MRCPITNLLLLGPLRVVREMSLPTQALERIVRSQCTLQPSRRSLRESQRVCRLAEPPQCFFLWSLCLWLRPRKAGRGHRDFGFHQSEHNHISDRSIRFSTNGPHDWPPHIGAAVFCPECVLCIHSLAENSKQFSAYATSTRALKAYLASRALSPRSPADSSAVERMRPVTL